MKEMSLFESEINYKFGDACIAAPFTSKHSASIRYKIFKIFFYYKK